VRVNRLSLALMRVFERPLPEVLKETVMDPIGASDGWEWHGYDNSWIQVDGRRVQSVSGGGHWGGGMFVGAMDQARLGLLYLNKGRWDDKRILSEAWVKATVTPCAINPTYGLLWWLNTGGRFMPSATATSFFALGAGGHVVWIDPDHDLVAVMRWLDEARHDGFMKRVMAALS
jgi:CubicO group peptidase (beta-lactamase class C family)